MSIRDHKRLARRHLHDGMSVPAYYIPNREIPSQFTPCRVRVHTKFAALGTANQSDTAERTEATPRLIFWASEIPHPTRFAIVSVEPGEAYYVDACEPRDDLTITAMVSRVDEEDTAGLPVPEASS